MNGENGSTTAKLALLVYRIIIFSAFAIAIPIPFLFAIWKGMLPLVYQGLILWLLLMLGWWRGSPVFFVLLVGTLALGFWISLALSRIVVSTITARFPGARAAPVVIIIAVLISGLTRLPIYFYGADKAPWTNLEGIWQHFPLGD